MCDRDSDCPYEYAPYPDVCTPEGACCPRVVDDSSCGGSYQDSYATLMSMLGPAVAEPFLPEVSFVTPTDLATVASSFTVEVAATEHTARPGAGPGWSWRAHDHCLVCAKPSGDLVCDTCRVRIEADAFSRKRQDEKSGSTA